MPHIDIFFTAAVPVADEGTLLGLKTRNKLPFRVHLQIIHQPLQATNQLVEFIGQSTCFCNKILLFYLSSKSPNLYS